MNDNNSKMTFTEFKEIYESLDLRRKDIVLITGKTLTTQDKWKQEDVVKDSSTATLFQLAVILQGEPHYYTKKDIVKLLFEASDNSEYGGTFFDLVSDPEKETTEKTEQMNKRLQAMLQQLQTTPQVVGD